MKLGFFLPLAYAFVCGTNKALFDEFPVKRLSHTQRAMQESTVHRADTIETIRFHLEYSLNDDLATQEKIKRRLEKFTIPWFKHVLKVHPVIGNLTLPNIFTCGPVEVPEYLKTVGVPADIIIFVNSDSFPFNSFAARAAHCANEDPPFENVIAGFLQVNSFFFNQLSEEDELQLFPHEITHILGFSQPLFDYYHKAADVLYEPEEIQDFSFERGAPVRRIILPQVVAAAREEFGCDSLEGVEVEGTTQDIGSHWEKRTMFHEYMISDITIKEVVFSRITVALLNSTGWYFVDPTYTQPIGNGYKQGCSYLVDPCLSAEKALFEEFCDSFGTEVCESTHLHVGVCNLKNLTLPVPAFYQWFDDPELGGLDMFNDYCPYVRPLDSKNCRGREVNATLVNPQLYGDEACSDCRCVEGVFQSNSSVKDRVATCYRVLHCDLLAHEVTLKVGDAKVNCSFTGEEVAIPGLSGSLNCPASDILCRPAPCIHACNGVGLCNNGICSCDPGYGGDNCGTICADECQRCEDQNPASCTRCYANAELFNSTCQCSQGFVLTNGICVPEASCTEGLKYFEGSCVETCPANSTIDQDGVCSICSENCLTCTKSHDHCSACYIGEFLYENECFQECPFGTFSVASTCQDCSANCQACATKANFCTMCRPPLVLSDGVCTNTCPREVSVKIGNICYPCASNCKTCSGSPSSCSECAETAFSYEGECVTECPERYVRSDDQCLKCTYPCTRCELDLTSCTACEGSLFVFRGTCVSACPSWTVVAGNVCQG